MSSRAAAVKPRRKRRDHAGVRPAAPKTSAGAEVSAAPSAIERLISDVRLPIALFLLTRVAYVLNLASSDPVLEQVAILDSIRYQNAAKQIADGALLGTPGVPAFGPLYPYFVATFTALGLGLWGIYLAQVALAAITTWLVFRIGVSLFGRSAGVLASSAWALYGAAGMFELKLIETTLATTLTTGTLYLLLPARGPRLVRHAGAGLLLGLACLARPNALLLLPVLAAWEASRGTWTRFRGSAWRRTAAFTLAAGSVLALSGVRNLAVAGEWALVSSQGGVTFYQGNNARADGTYSRPAGFSGDPERQAEEALALASRGLGRDVSSRQADAYWYDRGLEYLASDPANALGLWLRKLAFWFGSDEVSMEYVLSAERELHWALWLAPISFGSLLAAAVLRVDRRWLRGKQGLLFVTLAASLVTTLLFFFASRYRVPAVPALAVFAGGGLARLATVRVPFRLALATAVLSASSISWSPAYGLQKYAYYYALGNEYYRAGAPLEAARYFELAIAGRPDSWAMRHNLGEVYGVLGKHREAVDQLRIARRLDPTQPRTTRALAHYAELLRERP